LERTEEGRIENVKSNGRFYVHPPSTCFLKLELLLKVYS